MLQKEVSSQQAINIHVFGLCTTSAIQSEELCYKQQKMNFFFHLKCVKFDSWGHLVMYKIVFKEADHRTVNGLQKRGKKGTF